MSKYQPFDDPPEDRQSEELLGTLFQHASIRQKAPGEDERAIRDAVMKQWRTITRQRKQKHGLFAVGLAASLVLAIFVVINFQGRSQTAANLDQIAVVEKQSGDIYIRRQQGSRSEPGRLADSVVYAGQVLSVSRNSGLALNWTNGESVRIAAESELVLVSAGEIELIAGKIYIDTENASRSGSPFVIRTIAGSIQHLGTQYMAGIQGQEITLTVREGEVRMVEGSSEYTVHSGEKLSVGAAGIAEVTQVPTFGQMWEWASLLLPEINLDGRTAFDFIHWVGRETGRKVVFDTAVTRKLAKETRLRGRVNLEPGRALELILQTSDLEAVIENGDIVIRKTTGP